MPARKKKEKKSGGTGSRRPATSTSQHGAIPIGARVRVERLTAAPELNGTHGRVVQWLEDKQRYAVELDARRRFTTKALKEANLDRITPATVPEPSPHYDFSSPSAAVRNAAMQELYQGFKGYQVR